MKKIVLSFILILVLLIFDFSFNGNYKQVAVSKVKKTSYQNYITAQGVVVEEAKKEIYVDIPYRAEDIYCQIGQTVEIGQPLIKLSAKHILNEAKIAAMMGNMSADITEMAKMIKSDESNICSPISGTVTQIFATKGSVLNIVKPVVVVSDLTNLKIKANISENLMKNVDVGQTVEITGNGFEEKSEGIVSYIYPTAGKAFDTPLIDTTVEVMIELKNGSPKIKPGFTAELKIHTNLKEDILAVPYQAITQDADGNDVVYVAKNGYAKKVIATFGDELDYDVEVKKGIKENDYVVLNPKSTQISDLDKINAIGDKK